jgi:hypothetical protein
MLLLLEISRIFIKHSSLILNFCIHFIQIGSSCLKNVTHKCLLESIIFQTFLSLKFHEYFLYALKLSL